MKNYILKNVQNDPAYSQIVQLYSGLFDSQDERETFILDITKENILLAALCKASSVEEENLICAEIEIKCSLILNQDTDFLSFSNALMALLELEKMDLIRDFLIKIKPRNIKIIHQVMNQIPISQSSFKLLTTILSANPSYFIRDFLKMSDSFIEKSIYFDAESVNEIFCEFLKKNNIKVNYIFSFLKKHINLIELEKYKLLATNKLLEFKDLDILLEWIKIFKIETDPKQLINQLLEINNSMRSLYMAVCMLKNIKSKDKINILHKMQKSDREHNRIIFYMYINAKGTSKLHLSDYENYEIKVDKDCFATLEKFKTNYLKIANFLKKNNYLSNLKIGDTIKVSYASKRHNHYVFTTNNKMSFSYLLPFKEVDMQSENFNKSTSIHAKVIYVDYLKKEVYISSTQLESNIISFNKEYLNHFNIGEVVSCKIRNRNLKNKVSVYIYGGYKKHYAIINKGKEHFEGITNLNAKIVQIENEIIILDPIDSQKDVSRQAIYTNLLDIKMSNLSILEKLKRFLRTYFIEGERFTLHNIHNQVIYITGAKLLELFPTKKWFIDTLLDLSYAKKLKDDFVILKKIDEVFFEIIKERLFDIGFNSAIFNTTVIKSQIIECSISKIAYNIVFVKIKNENRVASIYIGELSNGYINNIFDFEYKGAKLHIGQKLLAQVISIDKQERINLSLKQVGNMKK